MVTLKLKGKGSSSLTSSRFSLDATAMAETFLRRRNSTATAGSRLSNATDPSDMSESSRRRISLDVPWWRSRSGTYINVRATDFIDAGPSRFSSPSTANPTLSPTPVVAEPRPPSVELRKVNTEIETPVETAQPLTTFLKNDDDRLQRLEDVGLRRMPNQHDSLPADEFIITNSLSDDPVVRKRTSWHEHITTDKPPVNDILWPRPERPYLIAQARIALPPPRARCFYPSPPPLPTPPLSDRTSLSERDSFDPDLFYNVRTSITSERFSLNSDSYSYRQQLSISSEVVPYGDETCESSIDGALELLFAEQQNESDIRSDMSMDFESELAPEPELEVDFERELEEKPEEEYEEKREEKHDEEHDGEREKEREEEHEEEREEEHEEEREEEHEEEREEEHDEEHEEEHDEEHDEEYEEEHVEEREEELRKVKLVDDSGANVPDFGIISELLNEMADEVVTEIEPDVAEEQTDESEVDPEANPEADTEVKNEGDPKPESIVTEDGKQQQVVAETSEAGAKSDTDASKLDSNIEIVAETKEEDEDEESECKSTQSTPRRSNYNRFKEFSRSLTPLPASRSKSRRLPSMLSRLIDGSESESAPPTPPRKRGLYASRRVSKGALARLKSRRPLDTDPPSLECISDENSSRLLNGRLRSSLKSSRQQPTTDASTASLDFAAVSVASSDEEFVPSRMA